MVKELTANEIIKAVFFCLEAGKDTEKDRKEIIQEMSKDIVILKNRQLKSYKANLIKELEKTNKVYADIQIDGKWEQVDAIPIAVILELIKQT